MVQFNGFLEAARSRYSDDSRFATRFIMVLLRFSEEFWKIRFHKLLE